MTQYRTFSFGLARDPNPTYGVSPQSIEVELHMREFISSELLQKGYVEDNIDPNFIVRFSSGTKKPGGKPRCRNASLPDCNALRITLWAEPMAGAQPKPRPPPFVP